jgi:hypothetical protein
MLLTRRAAWRVVQEKAEAGLGGHGRRLADTLAHLDAMGSALAAARAYSAADCCIAAERAAQTAVRLGQQVQAPSPARP